METTPKRHPYSYISVQKLPINTNNRFGPPRSPVANLSPPCRLPVAFLALLAPCRSPVACLSLPCRSPVAPQLLPCHFPVAVLPPSCRYPVASYCFLSFPGAMLLFAWRLPIALLSLSCRFFVSPSYRYFLLPPCRPPVACLPSSCCFSFASLSPPCRFSVAQRGTLSLSCRFLPACLSLASCLLVASLSPPCCLLVAQSVTPLLPCCILVACLSLSCELPVAYVSLPYHFPVACLSHSWRFLVQEKKKPCRCCDLSLLPCLSPSCASQASPLLLSHSLTTEHETLHSQQKK